MRYFINKKEPLNINHLSVKDKMQAIFDWFETGIEVISDRLDDSIFIPIFRIRFNGAILELKVSRTLIEDFSDYNHDKNYIIFLDKKSIYEGNLKISCKKISK
jgi:hypothetical protein